MYWIIGIVTVYIAMFIYIAYEMKNAPDMDEKTGKLTYRNKKKDK